MLPTSIKTIQTTIRIQTIKAEFKDGIKKSSEGPLK